MIMLFAHPAVSGQTFFFFSCHEIDGVKYLIADYSLSCDGSEWLRLLPFAIFMVVFFVIGVPLLLLILLVKNRTAIKKIGRSVDEALAELAVLKEMGETIDIDKARALYRKIDTDNSGTIDFAEFAKFQLESEDDGVTEVGARSRRSIRRRATSTVISNALVASHNAEQDDMEIAGDERQGVTVRTPPFRREQRRRTPGSAGNDLQGIGGTGGHGVGTEVTHADGNGDGDGGTDEDLAYLHNWYNNSRREVGGVGGVESKGKTDAEKVGDLSETKEASEGAQEIRQMENTRRRRANLVSAHVSHEASTRILAEDTQGSILAKERAAAGGDGVEMMLGVLWLNYKPECFFFDM